VKKLLNNAMLDGALKNPKSSSVPPPAPVKSDVDEKIVNQIKEKLPEIDKMIFQNISMEDARRKILFGEVKSVLFPIGSGEGMFYLAAAFKTPDGRFNFQRYALETSGRVAFTPRGQNIQKIDSISNHIINSIKEKTTQVKQNGENYFKKFQKELEAIVKKHLKENVKNEDDKNKALRSLKETITTTEEDIQTGKLDAFDVRANLSDALKTVIFESDKKHFQQKGTTGLLASHGATKSTVTKDCLKVVEKMLGPQEYKEFLAELTEYRKGLKPEKKAEEKPTKRHSPIR